MTKAAFFLAGLALVVCVAVPVLRFLGITADADYKSIYLASTVLYFLSATYWAVKR